MKVTIKDHKGGHYTLFTKDGKTFVQSIGRYRFCGEVIRQDSTICIGGKLDILYQKEGIYCDVDDNTNVFESDTITEIIVSC